MALKENYKDDILDVSVNTKRKYKMTDNGDGTVSFDDETVYTQEGDSFGASDLNDMAHAINNIATDAEHTSYDNTTSGLQATNVQDAVDEINDNLAQTPITVGGETLSTIDEKLNYLVGITPQFEIISEGYYQAVKDIELPFNSNYRYLVIGIMDTPNGALRYGAVASVINGTVSYLKAPHDNNAFSISISNNKIVITNTSYSQYRTDYALIKIQ